MWSQSLRAAVSTANMASEKKHEPGRTETFTVSSKWDLCKYESKMNCSWQIIHKNQGHCNLLSIPRLEMYFPGNALRDFLVIQSSLQNFHVKNAATAVLATLSPTCKSLRFDWDSNPVTSHECVCSIYRGSDCLCMRTTTRKS